MRKQLTKDPSIKMSKKTLVAMVNKRDRLILLMGESAAKEMRRMQLKIDDLLVKKLNDNTDMQLRVAQHHRDELLKKVRKLEGLLKKG